MTNDYFNKAIIKYGWNNFKHEILFDNLSKKEAEQKEIELIAKYKSNKREYGYNLESGGFSKGEVAESTREKLRKANLGKKLTEECKEKIRQSLSGRTCIISEETRNKMSLSHKGKQYMYSKGYKQTKEHIENRISKITGSNNGRAKPIDQYDLEGNFIKRWDYMKLIVLYLGISSNTHITQCCQGKRNKAYGYVWKYSD